VIVFEKQPQTSAMKQSQKEGARRNDPRKQLASQRNRLQTGNGQLIQNMFPTVNIHFQKWQNDLIDEPTNKMYQLTTNTL
jgi:hypothetical protein